MGSAGEWPPCLVTSTFRLKGSCRIWRVKLLPVFKGEVPSEERRERLAPRAWSRVRRAGGGGGSGLNCS